MKNSISIFWFRRDLRLEDNFGLFQALSNEENILPIFIFDKNILENLDDKKDKRVSFIYKVLNNLNKQLLSLSSSLYTIHDEPLNAFKIICESYQVNSVYTNHDYEPYAINRDSKISDWLKTKNINFKSFKDQVIFEKNEILKSDGTPYTIFTPYSKIWKQRLHENKIEIYPTENWFSHFLKTKSFHFPSLKELGFESSDTLFEEPQIENTLIQNYHQTRNIPSIIGTSRLSVHIRFGTISVRKLVLIALEFNETWLNELIWREFFKMILFHFPQVIHSCFKKKYDFIEWRNDEDEFNKWCSGQTGYPIVDAGMIELNETGFMHNRVRMIVASFLTKHLLIDWRWGEAYFASKLLDYELASNNGNWQWAAGCGCDAAPYFRIFNPSEQTKKFDPDLTYINKWVSEFHLQNFPPMIEHAFARKRALEIYKKSLNRN